MIRCLCCGKEILKDASDYEKKVSWHKRCIRAFFDMDTIPDIDFSKTQLEKISDKNASKGITIAGVQKKLSLHLSYENAGRLTLVDYPAGYILKPQTEEYNNLPELEDMAMHIAGAAGAKTVSHALIMIDGEFAYITKRIDRDIDKNHFTMYAMEDFCQLDGRLTEDKYKGSYEGCARIIKRYSERPGLDLSEMFLRLVISFIVGNSDLHLKNFSLIEEESAGRRFVLSRAYDILPVNVVLPKDKEQMALTLNGKKRNIRKKDFYELAGHCDIPLNSAQKIIKRVCGLSKEYLRLCDESYISDSLKMKMSELINERIEVLNV